MDRLLGADSKLCYLRPPSYLFYDSFFQLLNCNNNTITLKTYLRIKYEYMQGVWNSTYNLGSIYPIYMQL